MWWHTIEKTAIKWISHIKFNVTSCDKLSLHNLAISLYGSSSVGGIMTKTKTADIYVTQVYGYLTLFIIY